MTDDATLLRILADANPEFDFAASDDFLRDGGIDSFLIVVLVTELESAFAVSIPGELIVPEYFTNLQGLERLIVESRGRAS